MAPINGLPIRPIQPSPGLQSFSSIEFPNELRTDSVDAAGQPSFKDFMLEAIDHVNTMQQEADRAVEQLATGGEVNTAEVLTAIQKADMSFRMMMQVRNKLVQAYQEIKDIRI